MAEEKSFWSTLPGLLTGLGSFIAAITGLVLGLNSLGIIGNSQQSATNAKQIAVASNVTGKWQAEVKYDWGKINNEYFALTVDGASVTGSASFLGSAKTIKDGKLIQDVLSFSTESSEISGGEEKKLINHYRGIVAEDEIRFELQIESSFSPHDPVRFSARKISR